MGLFKNNIAQNLIRNGSFELNTLTICNGNFNVVNDWENIASPDYYHYVCSPANYGVPINRFGEIYAVNGNAYIGAGMFILPYETKEYIFQHLSTPLIANKSYYVSFYVSKADRFKYSVKSIGANFSVNQPSVAVSNTWIPANPQVQNQNGFLTDTVEWIKIEGYFTAQGGEEYMTIGNFNSNADTDTLNSGTTNPIPFDTGTAYYYIDSVSLYDALTMPTGIKDISDELEVMSLYPNPNNGSFTLEYKIQKEATLIITDVTGQEINRYVLLPSQNKLPVNEQELGAGIYFYSVRQGNQLLKYDKIIIIK